MKRDELSERLSRISTKWTMLYQAHAGGAEAAGAQRALLERYGGAVYRYLLAAVRDPDAADELAQEFAVCLLRGEFRQADPGRGRFRSYVKTVLFHLVSKFRKRQEKQPRQLPADSSELAAPAQDLDREFNDNWRDQVLSHVWEALARTQPAFHTVLRFRAEHPEMRSADMARQLGRQLGKPLTADSVRQMLKRARDQFAGLLLDEVAQSLEAPTGEQLAQELADLDLLEYCRPALEQRGRGRS